jgi:glutamyl-tRNA reductase
MAIVVCGLSHKTVPLPTLEQLAFRPEDLPKSLGRLMDHEAIHEGVILSTCNRTEVYATVHRFHPAVDEIRTFLSDVSGVPSHKISEGLYTYYDTSAVRHLFNVASGVDSMVLGEPQILGQVRDAYKAAADEGTARRMLSALFQRALRVGKRVRTQTAIARHVVSLPQAAARVASDLAGELDGKTVLVIGAGRMAELAARAALDNGCTAIVIANRTPSKALSLAETLGGRGVSLDDVPQLLGSVDVVISVTSSAEPVITRDVLARATVRRSSNLVAIDLGMPRNIEGSSREISLVTLRDLTDLGDIVERGAQARQAELPKVESVVAGEVDEFCAWERSLALDPAITELREWAEQIRQREVAKLAKGLGDTEREALERATRGLMNKLLHRPMTQMRELVRGKDGQVYLEAFQEIFDLPGGSGE